MRYVIYSDMQYGTPPTSPPPQLSHSSIPQLANSNTWGIRRSGDRTLSSYGSAINPELMAQEVARSQLENSEHLESQNQKIQKAGNQEIVTMRTLETGKSINLEIKHSGGNEKNRQCENHTPRYQKLPILILLKSKPPVEHGPRNS